ncbi:MAG: 30S ribosomal protein S18 [Alphaproteobacteria bacterium]|nr:30S ribosomal protein S18 [Alphaproteobacteria bacterium]
MRRERETSPRGGLPAEEGAAAGATGGAGGGGRRPFFRRRKTCPFNSITAPKLDWKDVKLLGRYISERGKIVPSRISAVSTHHQRDLANAIKRARFMALLPYARESGDFS